MVEGAVALLFLFCDTLILAMFLLHVYIRLEGVREQTLGLIFRMKNRHDITRYTIRAQNRTSFNTLCIGLLLHVSEAHSLEPAEHYLRDRTVCSPHRHYRCSRKAS